MDEETKRQLIEDERRYEYQEELRAEREEPYRDDFFNSFTEAEYIEFLQESGNYKYFEEFDKSSYTSTYLAVKDFIEMELMCEFFDYYSHEFQDYIDNSWSSWRDGQR